MSPAALNLVHSAEIGYEFATNDELQHGNWDALELFNFAAPIAADIASYLGGRKIWAGLEKRPLPGRLHPLARRAEKKARKRIAKKLVDRNIGRGWKAYEAAREAGQNIFRAAGAGFKAAGSRALAVKVGGFVSKLSWATFLVPTALELGKMAGQGLSFLGEYHGSLEFGSSFFDTEQAYTMRQAGLQAIHESQLNTRSLFGREAQYFHR